MSRGRQVCRVLMLLKQWMCEQLISGGWAAGNQVHIEEELERKQGPSRQ